MASSLASSHLIVSDSVSNKRPRVDSHQSHVDVDIESSPKKILTSISAPLRSHADLLFAKFRALVVEKDQLDAVISKLKTYEGKNEIPASLKIKNKVSLSKNVSNSHLDTIHKAFAETEQVVFKAVLKARLEEQELNTKALADFKVTVLNEFKQLVENENAALAVIGMEGSDVQATSQLCADLVFTKMRQWAQENAYKKHQDKLKKDKKASQAQAMDEEEKKLLDNKEKTVNQLVELAVAKKLPALLKKSSYSDALKSSLKKNDKQTPPPSPTSKPQGNPSSAPTQKKKAKPATPPSSSKKKVQFTDPDGWTEAPSTKRSLKGRGSQRNRQQQTPSRNQHSGGSGNSPRRK